MTTNQQSDPTVYIPVILREARGLLGRYSLSDDASVSLLHQSENTMILVEDPARGVKQVLRVHSQRLAYHGAASIASELMWMEALRADSDVIVPGVVAPGQGSLVQVIDAPDLDQPRHAVMFTFLNGGEPTEDILPQKFEMLGEITARMHKHARGWTRPTAFTRHHWNLETILGADPLWGHWQDGMGVDKPTRAILERMASTVTRRLTVLGQRSEVYTLIHADMRLANLLVEGDLTKVIDFDDCGYSWTLYDLATALSFLEDRPYVPELIDSWLAGYRKVADVARDVEAEIPTIMMLRRLAEIAWLGTRRHLDFAQSLGAGFTRDSCALAETYLGKFG